MKRHEDEQREGVVAMAGVVDGNVFEMAKANSYLRRTPIKAVRMMSPFIVQNKDVGLLRFEAGDWLCEMSGVRWGVKAEDFGRMYKYTP